MNRRLLPIALAVPAVAALGSSALRDWGSTDQERVSGLLGDDLVPVPASRVTLAVTVDAPAERVWSWIAQIGQDRGGFYSYDWLENIFGLGVHSARRIHEQWQHPQVGDAVRLVPAGLPGLRNGVALRVADVRDGSSLVLREQPPDLPWDAVWSFHVIAQSQTRSRLISRSVSAAASGPLLAFGTWITQPVTLLMTRRMLLGVKARAEGAADGRSPGSVRAPAV